MISGKCPAFAFGYLVVLFSNLFFRNSALWKTKGSLISVILRGGKT